MAPRPKRRHEMRKEIQDKSAARKEKKKEKAKRRAEGAPKQVPHTIESLRIKDPTTVGDLEAEENVEVLNDIQNDEFSDYFKKAYVPKVIITYSDNPFRKTRMFGRELSRIIPNSEVLFRRRCSVKKIVKAATEKGYSDILIINENQKKPNGMLMIHLPNGPTAHFKMSNVKITPELNKSYKEMTDHRPEVILNNFTTRLGYSVSRMLAALFHYEPEFKGRRAVTFHNQRDYIFFRHHRYMFTKEAKPRLMELGPRFTLKLRSLQKGTFDSKTGEYEWIIQGRRHEMETSRRKFFL